MTHLDAESAHLKQVIDDAFRDVRYPGEDTWALARCVDVSEEERVVEILGGKRWEDWKDRPLEALKDAIHMPQLSFLSDAAFHYYLPLYMLVAAFHSAAEADVLPSHLIGSLTRPDDPGHFYHQRMKRFSEQQLQAILQFIDYYTARHADKYDEAACRAARDSIQALLAERH